MVENISGCDLTIRIGGEAGQGMQIMSNLLGKVFVRIGLYVFINQDVMSRIRGGHNFSQIRVSSKPIRSMSSDIDILVCLDENTLNIYKDKIGKIVIYDKDKIKENQASHKRYIAIPLEEIAKNVGKNPKMVNTVAAGAILSLLDLSLDTIFSLLTEIFATKGDEVINANKSCIQAGYDYVKQIYKDTPLCKFNVELKRSNRMLISGSETIALGAIASNLRFYSAYPMSPSTHIMEYLASKQKQYGLIVEQAEDEISAINMALGAYFCGARAMTGTSGGGLALMVESISLAGMTETPIVIIDAQRPGPATGLPTRTEQADLLFVTYAGHGEFPRVILSPSTPEKAFYLINRAFYFTEKYQIPVFILVDQYFNDSLWTVEEFNLENININKQGMLSYDDLKNIEPFHYRRYEITDSGISPRITPGTPNQVLYVDSDEHNEEGHITESADVRKNMVEKRLKKITGLYKEISSPDIYPNENADSYIVSWGSTFGVIEEVINILRQKGVNIGYIHFSEVYPLREDIIPNKILKNSKLISVENNATGQFTKLLKTETGFNINNKILKYDGRPFNYQELVEKIKRILE